MIKLLLSAIMLAYSAQAADRVTSVEDLAAYLRIDSFLMNPASGESDTYECIVPYVNKTKRHSQLYVISEQLNKTILQFDPSSNMLLKIFAQDVTGDGHVDLISEWTHGNAMQLAIHTLGPVPKLVFLKAYRYGMSIYDDQDFKTRIRILSGSGIGQKVTTEEYIWSKEKSEFIVDK